MQRSLHSQHSAPEMLCPHFPPVYLPVLLNHSLSLSFQKILPFVRSVTDHSAFAAADPDFVHLAMYLFPTAQAVNPFYHRQNLLPGSPNLPAPAVPPEHFLRLPVSPAVFPTVSFLLPVPVYSDKHLLSVPTHKVTQSPFFYS